MKLGICNEFGKPKHPDRKVVLKADDEGKMITEVRSWRSVPCDPKRCYAHTRWGCQFLCPRTNTAPPTYEEQVFAGNQIECELFKQGFDIHHLTKNSDESFWNSGEPVAKKKKYS